MSELKDRLLIYASLFPKVSEERLISQFRRLGFSRRGISRVLHDLVKGNWLERTEEGQTCSYRSLASFSSSWDGKFRLVFFDVPEKDRQIRDSLRNHLRSLGGGQWQRSVWVFWRDVTDDLWDFLALRGWEKYVVIAEAAQMVGIGSNKDFAAGIWGLDRLNSIYTEILEDWRAGYERLQREPEKLARLADELTKRYLTSAASDPFLPEDLLPDKWSGGEIRKLIASLERIR